MGYSKNDIVNEFYEKENYSFDEKNNKWKTKFDPENYKSKNFSEEVIDARNNKIVIKAGEKVKFLNAKKLQTDGLKDIYVSKESLFGKFLRKRIDLGTDEEKFEIGMELNETVLDKLVENKIFNLEISKTIL